MSCRVDPIFTTTRKVYRGDSAIGPSSIEGLELAKRSLSFHREEEGLHYPKAKSQGILSIGKITIEQGETFSKKVHGITNTGSTNPTNDKSTGRRYSEMP